MNKEKKIEKDEWDFMKSENVAKMKKTKKYKELEERNVKDFYNITSKILKLEVLSSKDSAHLVVMFSEAICDSKSKKTDEMFAKLINLSIKHSKK